MTNACIPTVATVRGVVVLGLLDWTRREHGEPGVERLLQRLPVSIRDRYGGPRPKIVATTPIPGEELDTIARAIIELWGVPAYHTAASHVAVSDLNGYMKLFMRIGTPNFILRRLPRVLSHYCSHGELTVDDVGHGVATLSIREAEAYGAAITEGAVGWIRAALELSGAQGVLIETRHESGRSRYALRWRPTG
jgi:hypothetical protein